MTYLDKILAAHRSVAAGDERPFEPLLAEARSLDPARGFGDALNNADGLAVIAEIKRRSPSRGDLCPDLDPVEVARAYFAGDATCLSVLTDADFFGGSPADLAAARRAVEIPVLRKDFVVSARDVLDARIMGADCVLLIVAALGDTELADFHGLADEIGLDVLVEVHDEPELERALAVDARIVGVNQRDLATFEVDHDRASRMAPQIPDGVVRVAESGVRGPGDASQLVAAGYDAVLVGESVVKSADRTRAVAALRHC